MPVWAAVAGGASQASAAPRPSALRSESSRRMQSPAGCLGVSSPFCLPGGRDANETGPRDEVAGAGLGGSDFSGAGIQRRPWDDGVSMTWVGGPWVGLVAPGVLPDGAGDDEGRGGTGIRAPPVG